MSPPSTFVDETDLHALVDGELDPDHRRRVEDHLLLHPGDAALVEDWRRQNAALRAAFEPIALETPPLSLRTAATRAAAQSQGPIETGATHWGRPSGTPRPRRIEDLRVRQRRQAALISALLLVSGLALAGLAAFVFAGGRSEAPRAPAPTAFSQGYVSRAGLTYATYTVDAHPVEFDATRRDELADRLKTRVGFSRIPDLSAPAGRPHRPRRLRSGRLSDLRTRRRRARRALFRARRIRRRPPGAARRLWRHRHRMARRRLRLCAGWAPPAGRHAGGGRTRRRAGHGANALRAFFGVARESVMQRPTSAAALPTGGTIQRSSPYASRRHFDRRKPAA